MATPPVSVWVMQGLFSVLTYWKRKFIPIYLLQFIRHMAVVTRAKQSFAVLNKDNLLTVRGYQVYQITQSELKRIHTIKAEYVGSDT